jgi:hypothetical protein
MADKTVDKSVADALSRLIRDTRYQTDIRTGIPDAKKQEEEIERVAKLIAGLKKVSDVSNKIQGTLETSLEYNKRQDALRRKEDLLRESNFKAYMRQNEKWNSVFNFTMSNFASNLKTTFTKDNVKMGSIGIMSSMGLMGNFGSQVSNWVKGFQEFKKSRDEEAVSRSVAVDLKEAHARGISVEQMKLMLEEKGVADDRIRDTLNKFANILEKENREKSRQIARDEYNVVGDKRGMWKRKRKTAEDIEKKEYSIKEEVSDIQKVEVVNLKETIEPMVELKKDFGVMKEEAVQSNELMIDDMAERRREYDELSSRQSKKEEGKDKGFVASVLTTALGAALGPYLAGLTASILTLPTLIAGSLGAITIGIISAGKMLADKLYDTKWGANSGLTNEETSKNIRENLGISDNLYDSLRGFFKELDMYQSGNVVAPEAKQKETSSEQVKNLERQKSETEVKVLKEQEKTVVQQREQEKQPIIIQSSPPTAMQYIPDKDNIVYAMASGNISAA